MIKVKIIRIGSEVREFALNDHATVQDALTAASMTLGNEDLRVGGEPASLSTVLHDADVVTLVPPIKGGH